MNHYEYYAIGLLKLGMLEYKAPVDLSQPVSLRDVRYDGTFAWFVLAAFERSEPDLYFDAERKGWAFEICNITHTPYIYVHGQPTAADAIYEAVCKLGKQATK